MDGPSVVRAEPISGRVPATLASLRFLGNGLVYAGTGVKARAVARAFSRAEWIDRWPSSRACGIMDFDEMEPKAVGRAGWSLTWELAANSVVARSVAARRGGPGPDRPDSWSEPSGGE
jgi:hypothetical protein